MQITSTSTSAAVPSGPSNGVMIVCTSSNGLPFEVSTILTATVCGSGSGGDATAVSGLPGSFVMTGVSGADPPGSSCFSSSTVSESLVNVPPFGVRNAWSFWVMLPLYSGSFVARSTSCRVRIQPGAAQPGENQRHDQQHSNDAAQPALESRHQGRKEKGEQRGERERDEQVAPEIKRGNDERGERNRPKPDESIGGCDSWFRC